jgi:DNA-binding MarR family transcriptional regulator
MNQKSTESYKKLFIDNEITLRQLQVLQILKGELGMGTNRMIAKALGWDINRVTGRVSELRQKGLIRYAGDFVDKETNRTVNLWKVSV